MPSTPTEGSNTAPAAPTVVKPAHDLRKFCTRPGFSASNKNAPTQAQDPNQTPTVTRGRRDKRLTHSKTVNQQRWKTFVVGIGKTPRLFLRCLLLVLFVFDRVVHAAFTPADSAALNTAVQACLVETNDGSCPIFAASNDATGHPYGAIGEWQTGNVTDMSQSK